MAITSHGHYIPGSPPHPFDSSQPIVARCGGVDFCNVCGTQARIYRETMEKTSKPKASHDEVMIHLVADALVVKTQLKRETIVDLLESGWTYKEQLGKPHIWVQKEHWYSY